MNKIFYENINIAVFLYIKFFNFGKLNQLIVRLGNLCQNFIYFWLSVKSLDPKKTPILLIV